MITIYGKKNCPHCKSAVEFCAKNDLVYEYHDVEEEGITSEFLVERAGVAGIRTVPQIFAGRKYVGGYTGLVKHISEMKQLNG